MDPTLIVLLLATLAQHRPSVGIMLGDGRPPCTFVEDGTGRYYPHPPAPCEPDRIAYMQAWLPPLWCHGAVWAPGTGGPPACERKPATRREP